jgi:hypothetical protein
MSHDDRGLDYMHQKYAFRIYVIAMAVFLLVAVGSAVAAYLVPNDLARGVALGGAGCTLSAITICLRKVIIPLYERVSLYRWCESRTRERCSYEEKAIAGLESNPTAKDAKLLAEMLGYAREREREALSLWATHSMHRVGARGLVGGQGRRSIASRKK